MSTSVDKSAKLIFNEFQKSISEVPLEVYYQINTSDSFSSSGFQFNIRQPGIRALLDTDIWIEYNIPLIETADYAIRNLFCSSQPMAAGANPNIRAIPRDSNKIAWRSGYLGWRMMQNFSLQINNQTLTTQPYRWHDVLNRLYVSNEQSKHEFSTSGGPFDSGRHVPLTKHMTYYDHEGQNQVRSANDFYPANGEDLDDSTVIPNNVANGDFQINSGDGAAGGANNNTTLCVSLVEGFDVGAPAYPLPGINGAPDPAVQVNRHLFAILRPRFPTKIYNYGNEGFNQRFEDFAMFIRYGGANANAAYAAGTQFDSLEYATAGNTRGKWFLQIFERLPCPLFKMYSNDSVFGVIPNIVTMQIQGTWMNTQFQNIFRANTDEFVNDFGIDWSLANTSLCHLYLKWYTPPMNMPIPREISCPYPKITTWTKSINLATVTNAGVAQFNVGTEEQEYNITIESIPDLLLIYLRTDPTYTELKFPDDHLMHIEELLLNIDNASGKLNQMKTIDLYNKWKKILKHSDSNITPYEEWYKFCCVACLQPEDYGVRYGPGYSNQSVLGMKIKYKNWWNIPSFMYAPNINMANRADNTTLKGLLHVTCIYNRNRLILRADGSAAQELLKVAADFNAINSVAQFNDIAESANRLSMA